MKNNMKSRVSIGMCAIVASVASPAALAHVGGQANAAYAGDSRGHLVIDGAGKCVRTGTWTPALALSECEPGMAPKAAAKSEPVVAAKAAAQPAIEKITLKAGALFDVGKADLKPAGISELDGVAAKLGTADLEQITVTGHTDSTGAAESNQRLSERRAEAVKAYLVQKGVKADRVVTAGKGSSNPVADNKTADGRAKNRRVEIELKAQRSVEKK
jgi:OOP family OmpA-OmpF porin